MTTESAGSIVVVRDTLIVHLDAVLMDSAVRHLREEVGRRIEARAYRGLVLDVGGVDVMDSYITRCIRDLAIGARLMGVPTVLCGLQPAVAETLVDMGIELSHLRTVLNLDSALTLLGTHTHTRDRRF